VLKAGSITFHPPLPSEKITAIERMGFGLLDKIVLRFSSAFWPKGAGKLGMSLERLSLILYTGFTSSLRGEFPWWLNYHSIQNEPILVCFISAHFARAMQTISTDEVIARAVRTLRLMYGEVCRICIAVASYINEAWSMVVISNRERVSNLVISYFDLCILGECSRSCGSVLFTMGN